ncbi:MAG TPA: hypothetical protein VFQ22_01930 [Longimicrobiales bacterium]|nr:hypothetical protein [Longimicrobiales bacterium]
MTTATPGPDRDPERRQDEDGGSWLDEVSITTRIVFYVTLLAMAAAAVLYVWDLFF